MCQGSVESGGDALSAISTRTLYIGVTSERNRTGLAGIAAEQMDSKNRFPFLPKAKLLLSRCRKEPTVWARVLNEPSGILRNSPLCGSGLLLLIQA